MDKTDFKIGPQIRAWRKKRNMIQKELAAAVGMDVTQMWAIENDRNSPSLRTIARIADALQVSVPELMSSPNEVAAPFPPQSIKSKKRPQFNVLKAGDSDLLRIMRNEGRKDELDGDILRKLSKIAADAIALEQRFLTLMPTSLPFSLPITRSEAGARQLALAIRAHCDVGSAIIHDSLALFESYGIRILEAPLPTKVDAITFYSPHHRNFSVFISNTLKEKEMRSHLQFTFLSEIGRAFLFAANGFQIYRESARSRRFVHHFAATFLLPELTVLTTVNSLHVNPDKWTWKLLLRLKTRFGVSAQMFNIRLKELSLISRKKYKTLDSKIKAYYKNSTGKKEPEGPCDEISYRRGDLLALNDSTKNQVQVTHDVQPFPASSKRPKRLAPR